MSFIVLLAGLKTEELKDFYHEINNPQKRAAHKARLFKELERAGATPSYSQPTLFAIRDDFFAMMSNHEYKYRGFDVREVTRATLQARAEVHRQVEALRKLGGPWKNIHIVATPSLIGIREGRRIHGLYTVTMEDLRVGRKQPDSVCDVLFPIDVHATNPNVNKGVEKAPLYSKPYQIPMRALIAKDVQGLMMAGRCISGDFIAHSSYRVTGNASPMGEAAGKLAAQAAQKNVLPQELLNTDI